MNRWQAPAIGYIPRKKIIGFWHIAAMGSFAEIIAEQYGKLKSSGLYDASEKIVVGFIGGKGREAELNIFTDPKFTVFSTESIEAYEFPTLAKLWQEAVDNPESFLCYYFHTKGASWSPESQNPNVVLWRQYMEYFNIECWQSCVAALGEFETCGVELQNFNGLHYSGNFWWARSDYIRKLPNAYDYWQHYRHDRFYAESYLCMANPKAYCLSDFPENLYDCPLYPERYR